jgi:hypothetical protein
MESVSFGNLSLVGPALNTDQLEQLLSWSHREGASVVDRLRPGLTGDDMDQLTTPHGLELPTELKTWWGWHDGAVARPGDRAVDRELGPDLEFLPLGEAVEIYVHLRNLAAEQYPEDPEANWRREWFPISRNGRIVADCGEPDAELTPIRFVDLENGDIPSPTSASSFGEMVGWWLDELEREAWLFDDRRKAWIRNPDEPSPSDRSGLT